MSDRYWDQFSHSELMSMQGVEVDDPAYDEDEDIDHDDEEDEDDEPRGCSAKHPCSNCMDCLGMSWRDFM